MITIMATIMQQSNIFFIVSILENEAFLKNLKNNDLEVKNSEFGTKIHNWTISKMTMTMMKVYGKN